ncbi:ABC transporter ATP-binding protein [Carbonactinospora thermoautotrophica]|uniref:ABC transporter ATP-binding protein n=1 Tax=Carbonactinospora thermoautotrophica TaxID=1469144 RepID=UPI000836D4B3|nr:ABC transporter ATP-binding protein [Carbonactinospora thermoautotrophica]
MTRPTVTAPDTAEAADLRLVALTKRFGAFTAVDELDLVIPQGSFFALLGPSGCGKTTTLRMIAGLERPTSGRVLIGATDVTDTKPYQRPVNTVFQNYALFPHLDIFENVAFGLRRRGIRGSEVKRRVADALELVQLGHLARRKPAQLSGGQQQRVALARAIVNRPAVLLLDEPLGALDLKLRRQMQVELKRIQTEVGLTFVHVTHDQEEAMTMADTIAVMNAGRIEQLGDPTTLYENPRTTFVANFLGQSNLVAATLVGRDGEHLVVEAHGQRLALPAARCATSGPNLWLGVRPEKLRVVADGTAAPEQNRLTGVVTDASFVGVSTHYLVRMPWGQELGVVQQNDGTPPLRPGEQVTLTWDPAHTFGLDAAQDAHSGEDRDAGAAELAGAAS